jgi:hypothetical protein
VAGIAMGGLSAGAFALVERLRSRRRSASRNDPADRGTAADVVGDPDPVAA